MEDTRAESLPIGAAEAAAALQTLQRYKAGKAALDKRLIDKNCGSAWDTGKTIATR